MSGSGSLSSSVAPFTASQWHELEHQALIFKYLKAGLPVPPDLLVPIRTSLKFLSSSLFHHPTFGYCSYFGKKIDPEPGRCRRTDGKKWRCSKDAHPNSKYCERHMNRSRYRSRKPVESQNTSQSLSTTVGVDIGGNRSSIGSGGGGGSRSLSFQNPPLQPLGTREGLCFRSNMSQSQMAAIPYGIPNKEYSGQYRLQELKPEGNDGVLSMASESLRGFTMNSSVDNSWCVATSGSSSIPLSDQRGGAFLQNSCLPMQTLQDFDSLIGNGATSKQQQQHYFFGREFDSSRSQKQEHQALQPLPDELPKTIDFGYYLDDQRANKSSLSTTQLSMSTPIASSKFFETSAHSSKDTSMDKFLS